MIEFQNDWKNYLTEEYNKEYYQKMRKFLIKEYKTKLIYPNMYDIFNALHYTALKDTKVVIIGQDPYHGKGQAHGLSFSVNKNIQTPPSLQNIYIELQSDLGCYIPNNGYLKKWVLQGVLMLNAVLTVEAGKANSHRGIGWEIFTDKVIETVNNENDFVAFVLWGKSAQIKEELITNKNHLIIKSPHPSPFSADRGFFGSNPFSKINDFLKNNGKEEIDWQIENI